MNISVLGIDLAKNVFQLHGVDEKGKTVLTKKITRAKLLEFIVKLPPCLIGMEACGGSHFWARKFSAMGHTVKLMSPQFVKPYVKTNKNDARDAEAICEAVTRPTMRFVSMKTVEQQDILAIHRIRSRLIKERTGLVNQIRGLLMEYGIVIAQGISNVRKSLPTILESESSELSTISRELFNDLLCQLYNLDIQVKVYDKKPEQICRTNEMCQRLINVAGVGPITATAVVATVGDASIFKKGRTMSAFFGLVPRQHSSGGKQNLLGISKCGVRYIRMLLIHRARSVIYQMKNLPLKQADWLKSLIERRGINRATVALANKNARIMWALLTNNDVYRQAA